MVHRCYIKLRNMETKYLLKHGHKGIGYCLYGMFNSLMKEVKYCYAVRNWGRISCSCRPMATAMQNPGHICDPHHRSWQCWILNPLSEARDWTCVLMDASQICFHWATMGTSILISRYTCWLAQRWVTLASISFSRSWEIDSYWIEAGDEKHLQFYLQNL